MNIQEMQLEANKLIREWEANYNSPDLIERGEWTRGVVHGLKLMYHVLSKYIYKDRKEVP